MDSSIIVSNLTKVSISDVLQPNFLLRSEDTYIFGIVLAIKKCDRPLKLFKSTVNRFKPPVNESTYDRMIIVGEENNRTCFVIIAESASQSSTILRNEHLSVGSYVAVVEPMYSEHCLGNDQSNPIITTTKSLIPFPAVENRLLNLDILLNTSGTAMLHFALREYQLRFIQAQFVFPTCSGFLCDRRAVKTVNTCACIQKSSVAGWTVQARIVNEDNDLFAGVFFQSFALSKHFCTQALLRQPVSSLSEVLLRQAVGRVTTHVNNASGWHIEGFTKPGVSDENIAQAVQQVRICRIVPSCVIPDDIKYDVKPHFHNECRPLPLFGGPK